MRYSVTALELSKYIINLCQKYGRPISNLKLQHILYYIKHYCVKHLNEPLFFDNLEAWVFGAVNPNVYYYFCGHGANPITIKFDEKEYKSVFELNDKFKDVIDFIVEEKFRKPSWDLIKDIHKENGAWALLKMGKDIEM